MMTGCGSEVLLCYGANHSSTSTITTTRVPQAPRPRHGGGGSPQHQDYPRRQLPSANRILARICSDFHIERGVLLRLSECDVQMQQGILRRPMMGRLKADLPEGLSSTYLARHCVQAEARPSVRYSSPRARRSASFLRWDVPIALWYGGRAVNRPGDEHLMCGILPPGKTLVPTAAGVGFVLSNSTKLLRASPHDFWSYSPEVLGKERKCAELHSNRSRYVAGYTHARWNLATELASLPFKSHDYNARIQTFRKSPWHCYWEGGDVEVALSAQRAFVAHAASRKLNVGDARCCPARMPLHNEVHVDSNGVSDITAIFYVNDSTTLLRGGIAGDVTPAGAEAEEDAARRAAGEAAYEARAYAHLMQRALSEEVATSSAGGRNHVVVPVLEYVFTPECFDAATATRRWGWAAGQRRRISSFSSPCPLKLPGGVGA